MRISCTPEAEVVAADLAIRTEGLPALQLWDMVLERPVRLLFQEDNQATIQILKTQKKPTLRYLNRTHRVNVSWLREVLKIIRRLSLSIVKLMRWQPTSLPKLSLILLNGMQLWN